MTANTGATRLMPASVPSASGGSRWLPVLVALLGLRTARGRIAQRDRYAARNDTERLQQLIDAAATEGGGARVVLVERGELVVSFALQLRSNIVVVIDGTISTDGNPHSSWHGHKASTQSSTEGKRLLN